MHMLQPFVASSGSLLGSPALRVFGTQLPRVVAAAAASGVLSRVGGRHLGCRQRRHLPTAATAKEPAEGSSSTRYADNYKKVKVTVNGKQVTVPEGTMILEASEALGVKVPTLCAHPNLPGRPGTCRVCLVQVGNQLKPACATPVWDGMEVQTDTDRVKESVRGVLALMQANHPADCMNCEVNGACEFQDLTNRYRTREMLPKLRSVSREWDEELKHEAGQYQDQSGAAIHIDFEKCLKCGRCVTACGLVQDMNVMGMQGRGRERHPGVLTEAMDLSKCIECGQCSVVCPVGAITARSEWREVEELLESKRKVMVCITAPAVRVAIGEELGMAPGTINTAQMVTAQRMLGFDYVFDVNFSADLTIMEEGTELLRRLRKKWGLELEVQPDEKLQAAAEALAAVHEAEAGAGAAGAHGHHEEGPLPMFTSCCPGWITMVEKDYPELIPHLSTCKSPQGMMGAVIKHYFAHKVGLKPEDICLVSVMPCTAKKHEAEREELRRRGEGQDTDYVVTTREFGRMLREKHVPLASLPEGQFDSPVGEGTGAAQLFGNTGGVMEAALRTAYELATGQPLPKLEVGEIRGLGGVKEATIRLPGDAPAGLAGRELRVAVANGTAQARQLLRAMERGEADYDFVEVMACPGGCIGGGGQPKSHDPLTLLKRMSAVYDIDERSTIRKSHENPSIQQLYKDFLGEPGGELSHELLHTTYTDRSHFTVPAYSRSEREADVAARLACGHHPADREVLEEEAAALEEAAMEIPQAGSGKKAATQGK